MFRAECPRDLASWARGLVQGTHNVVASMREIAWGTSLTVDNRCRHNQYLQRDY